MKVNYKHKGFQFTVHYDEDGYLDFVEDTVMNESLMIEYHQTGKGYKITKTIGNFIGGSCTGMYVRVVIIDLYIPKFIYIKNK